MSVIAFQGNLFGHFLLLTNGEAQITVISTVISFHFDHRTRDPDAMMLCRGPFLPLDGEPVRENVIFTTG